MNTRQKQWLGYGLLVVAILVAGYFGVHYPMPDMPDYVETPNGVEQAVGPTRFRAIYVDHDATVGGTIIGDVTGDVTGNVTGDVTGNVTGNLTGDMTGDLTNSIFLVVTAQTAISLTDGGILTPTGTYQQIESAAEVTPTLAITNAAGLRYTTGTLLTIINTADTTINFADSGNVKSSGATALGQYDSWELKFDGTYWIERSQANN